MATPNSRNATVNYILNGTWTNNHKNVSGPYERFYNIDAPEDSDETYIIADMTASALALQEVFRDAQIAGKQLRVLGGTWSLSDAAYTKGWLLSTDTLGNYWKMKPDQVVATYTEDVTGLYLVQCDVSIEALNRYLEFNNRALKTSGASNGQTIAGAIATGTHGSAFQYGAMPEYVVGIHLIPGTDESIWLERASYPVITDAFAASLGVTITRNDDLFNAVLVSFGSFGIVAGVMIETDPIYLLETSSFKITNDDTLKQAMSTMDLAPLNLNATGEVPWHFEITFNPHDASEGYAKTIYKRTCPPGFQNPPIGDDELSPGEGLLGVIGKITDMLPGAIVSDVMGALISSSLKVTNPADPPVLMTPGGTFSSTTTKGIAYSMELGIDMANAGEVLDLLLSLSPEIDVYAGVISFRWVKQSTAMLGFTKFPITTTIEFNAAANNRTLDYYNRIWNELSAHGIPYTLHWGQMNNFSPGLIRTMYGDPVIDKWLQCRAALMTPEAMAVFSSDFMKNTGLG
jgi:FAD/FMN-containing dehydrogenase